MVFAKTQYKVKKTASDRGDYPNALASSPTKDRTKPTGLVTSDCRILTFPEVFHLFERSLRERGMRPPISLSDETDLESPVRMLRQHSVNGVILASSTLPPSFALASREACVPVAHSCDRHSNTPDVHVVGSDTADAIPRPGSFPCKVIARGTL